MTHYDAAVSRERLLIMVGVVAFARLASAEPCGDAVALRAELEHESVRAGHWNLAWRIVYTTLAVGQFAIAASGEASHDDTQSLWVGGAKSTLGALGAWTSPLRIHVPPSTGDACTDRFVLRGVAERAAADERRAFWTAHIGGLIINAAGALVVAERTSWKSGLLSFATGFPVSLINAYTMPRASWRRTRDATWTAGVTVTSDRYALIVRGAF
jgi:hypothetical protein